MNLHNNEAGRKVEWHQSHWHRGRTAWAESLQQPMATLDRLMSPGTSVGQGLVAGGAGVIQQCKWPCPYISVWIQSCLRLWDKQIWDLDPHVHPHTHDTI